ncbi:MAG TPA: UTP--glucose-1-phosphate uridylyltransferase [Thermoplasmata archaeon]
MKAVIPAAGYGTRFLPYTKASPKEMLPVLDKPAIQYVIEEAVHSGYDRIVLVTGRHKRSIEDHFDRSAELEQYLSDRGDVAALEQVKAIAGLANLMFVRQKEPRGLGHAVLTAAEYIDDAPFGLLLGDDLCASPVPCQQQLLESFRSTGASVIACQEVPRENVSKYGVIVAGEDRGDVFRIREIQEKPSAAAAKSNFVIVGRYQFTPGVLDSLRREAKSHSAEVDLTPAINDLIHHEDVFALPFGGKRYDIGDKAGWLLANLELGLGRDDFAAEIRRKYPSLSP